MRDEDASDEKSPPAASESSEPQQPEKLSFHILPTAGTMVGVCTTLVGLVKVSEIKSGPSRVDEFAALAALIFLCSASASYLALRGQGRAKVSAQLERIADALFIVGLISITLIALAFALELI